MAATSPPPPPSEPTVEVARDATRDEIPRELVFTCCEEVGLDPYRDFDEVLEALWDPPLRQCCESACDPCVLTIERAAALVRYRLPK